MNLEEEFEKLMQEVIDKIQTKKDSGEYDEWDANDLIEKVKAVLDHGDTSRYGNRCPEGHSDPDCGWSPSMGYHCY
jgi:hypothetical protein